MRKISARPLTVAASAVIGLAAMIAVGSGVSTAAPAHIPAAPAVHSVAMAKVAGNPNAVLPGSRLAVHTTQNGVNIRNCGSTASCAVVGTANSGDAINSWCFISAQAVNGNPFWDLVWDRTANRGGFISETLLSSGAQADTC
jgi:hypothetical protein